MILSKRRTRIIRFKGDKYVITFFLKYFALTSMSFISRKGSSRDKFAAYRERGSRILNRVRHMVEEAKIGWTDSLVPKQIRPVARRVPSIRAWSAQMRNLEDEKEREKEREGKRRRWETRASVNNEEDCEKWEASRWREKKEEKEKAEENVSLVYYEDIKASKPASPSFWRCPLSQRRKILKSTHD